MPVYFMIASNDSSSVLASFYISSTLGLSSYNPPHSTPIIDLNSLRLCLLLYFSYNMAVFQAMLALTLLVALISNYSVAQSPFASPTTMPPSNGGAPSPVTSMTPPPAATPMSSPSSPPTMSSSPPMIPTTPTPSMAPSPSSTPLMAPTSSISSPPSPMAMAPSPSTASAPGLAGSSADNAPSMPPVMSSPSFAAASCGYSMSLLLALLGAVALFV